MLNYELCKKLKDAGLKFEYPQTRENTHSYLDEEGNPCGVLGKGAVYVPTLEELIEACGEGFDRLSLNHLPSEYTKTTWKWIAHSYPFKIEGTGSTPSEAVANLYLMLNKK